MKMSRKSISKDSMGFENIDEFWRRESLENGSRRSSAATDSSNITSDADFDYNDDRSISDDETEASSIMDNSINNTPAHSIGIRSNFSTNEKLSSFNSMSIGSSIHEVDDDLSTDSFNNVSDGGNAANDDENKSHEVSMISHRDSLDSEVARIMSPGRLSLGMGDNHDLTPNMQKSNLRKSTGNSSEKRRVSFGVTSGAPGESNGIDLTVVPASSSSPLVVNTSINNNQNDNNNTDDYGYGDSGGMDDDYGLDGSSSNIVVSSKSAAASKKSPVNKVVVSKSYSSSSSNDNNEDLSMITPAKGNRKGNRYSTASEYTPLATPGSNDFPRGMQIRDETFIDESEEEMSSDGETDKDESFASETSYFESLKKKRRPDIEEEEEDTGVGRRSKRATKGQRFEYWKNERPVYDKGQMVGLLLALPTPKKGENPAAAKGRGRGRPPVDRTKLVTLSGRNEKDLDVKTLKKTIAAEARQAIAVRDPPVVLPKNRKYLDRVGSNKELRVFSNATGLSVVRECVSYSESLKFVQLPVTEDRPEGKEGAGEAASSFNVPQERTMPAWMSGCVELPPGAIKDQEGTGDCTQVFFVSDCQPQSLEIGVAEPDNPDWDDATAQRHLLNKGDSFYILPNNFYRIENHSKTKPCILNWVIINSVNVDEM